MTKHTIGWIGLGRMGEQMADRLIKAGHDVSIWNRTKSKADPLVKKGGKLVDKPSDLGGTDVVFTMVSTGKDVDQVLFGANGVMTAAKVPKIVVDCSSISVEESAELRKKLSAKGAEFVTCPVSGNAKVIKAGKLSAVASGPKAAFDAVHGYLDVFSPRGVSYVEIGRAHV